MLHPSSAVEISAKNNIPRWCQASRFLFSSPRTSFLEGGLPQQFLLDSQANRPVPPSLWVLWPHPPKTCVWCGREVQRWVVVSSPQPHSTAGGCRSPTQVGFVGTAGGKHWGSCSPAWTTRVPTAAAGVRLSTSD